MHQFNYGSGILKKRVKSVQDKSISEIIYTLSKI
jgi:hypothetical protein